MSIIVALVLGLEEQRGWGLEGTMGAVLFSLGGWAASPSSCELACNEMEMLRRLPGSGPALCSTDKVATLMEVWPFLEHGINSSSLSASTSY